MARVRASLRSVLSVPIADPDNPAGPLVGTFQIDSDLMIEETGFDEEYSHEMAERFADVLALLMKAARR